MAEKPKRQKRVSDEAKKRKRERNRENAKTRVELGIEFVRWRLLKEQEGCKSDSNLATLLLDCYAKTKKELADKNAPVCQPYGFDQSFTSSREALVNGDEDCQSALLLTSEVQIGAKLYLQNGALLDECGSGSIEVTLEPEKTEVQLIEPGTPLQNDDDSEFSEEEEEAVKRKKKESSDEDWLPQTISNKLTEEEERNCSSEEDSDLEYLELSDTDETSSSAQILKHLCSECGDLHGAKKHHTCQHKLKPYVCNMCGRRYANEVSLKIHSKTHTNDSEHRCWCCYAVFKTKQEKQAHKQIHQNQSKPYQCRHCSRSFAFFTERTKHNKIHRGPFEYKCDICGISFWEKSRLNRHMVVHTGEKPYKCSVCERGFKQDGHLRSHMRLHTGERPYACPHCDKAFNHNVSLKSHIQRYHPSESGTTVDNGCDGVLKTHDTQEHSEAGPGCVEDVQEQQTFVKPKSRIRGSGRPLGRPKRPKAEQREHSRSECSRQNKNNPNNSNDEDSPD